MLYLLIYLIVVFEGKFDMPVKNIYLTCEKGLDAVMPYVQESLSEIMDYFPEYKDHFPIINLGDWKDNDYITVSNGRTLLQPHKSVQWYIERAKQKAYLQNRWQERKQISIDQLCQDLANDPYAEKIPQMQLLITKHDLYGTQSNGQLLNFCNGVSKQGKFAIVSTARFLDENNRLDIERFRAVAMHEFGHLIGLTPNGRRNSYESLGTHCSNGDLMEQDLSGTAYVMAKTLRQRRMLGLPLICNDCINAGKEFFRREVLNYYIQQQNHGNPYSNNSYRNR